MATNVQLSPEARIVVQFASPDNTSHIAIFTNTRGNRDSFLIARTTLGGAIINTIAHRTTEEQARKRANLVWLTDKYGPVLAQQKYAEMYPTPAGASSTWECTDHGYPTEPCSRTNSHTNHNFQVYRGGSTEYRMCLGK
jgi:hypothetical protein